MMLFMAALSIPAINAQTNSPTNVKENLPDGNYMARVHGIEQRTNGAVHARYMATRNDALYRLWLAEPLCEKEISQLNTGLSLAKKDGELVSTQAALERERAERFSAAYSGEHALWVQAQHLQARWRVSKLFDNPDMPVRLKMAVPIVQTWLTAKRE